MCKKFICLFTLTIVASLVGITQAGLVAYYNFEDGSGTTATDSSGHAHHGTFASAPRTPGYTTDAAAGTYALDLTAGNSRTDSNEAHVGLGTWDITGTDGSFGYSMWFKWLGAEFWWADFDNAYSPIPGMLLMQANDDTDGLFCHFISAMSGSGIPARLSLWDPLKGRAGRWNTGYMVSDDQDEWVFLEVSYNGPATELSYRLDGGSWATDSWTPGSNTTSKLWLGGVPASTLSWYPSQLHGYIDDVKIYDWRLDVVRVCEANNPSPNDEATGQPIDVNLFWTPGECDPNWHRVYFDFNESNVINRTVTPVNVPGDSNETSPPISLSYGTTYYWRVDEVNNSDVVTPGDLWSFTVWDLKAYGEIPANGSTKVDPNVLLEWTPGALAVSHNVYLDTVDPPVTQVGFEQNEPNYQTNGLEFRQKYYWRVDGVLPGGDPCIGNVWNFTVISTLINEPSLFLEDWENLKVGDSAALNGWSVSGSPAIETGNIGRPSSTDTTVMNLNNDGNIARYDLQVQPGPEGAFRVEFDFRCEIGHLGSFEIPFSYGQDSAKQVKYKILGEDFYNNSPEYGYVKLQIYNGSTYVDLVDLKEEDKNYHFVDVFFAGSDTHRLTITGEGALILDGDLTIPETFDSSPFTYIGFGPKTGSDIKLFFDNISVASGNDKFVTIFDLFELFIQWLECTDPNDSSCTGWYWP